MSWAAHNTEAWDDICQQGIMAKLANRQNIGGNHFDREEVEEALIGAMECHAICLALCDWASKEIGEAEADYFSGLVDAAQG